MTRNKVIEQYFEKGVSPTLDASEWKDRAFELSDLAAHTKYFKVHLIIENSNVLDQELIDDLKLSGKDWVILK